MDILTLKYFLAIAAKKNLTGAAGILHISQPALSKRIGALESEIGGKLFARKSHGVVLTEKGFLLKKRAEEIIDMHDRAKLELSSRDNRLCGEIRIGGGETSSMKYLASTMRDFRSQHPEVTFDIYSDNFEYVSERLDKGLIDFGLVIQPADISKYEGFALPDRDAWGILARKDSPLAKRKYIRKNDLLKIPLIVSKQIAKRQFAKAKINKWFGMEIDKLNIVATYNLIYNAGIMVQEGMGCALAIGGLANTEKNSPLCFIPLSPRLESELNIIWKKNGILSKPAEIFLSNLQKISPAKKSSILVR